MDKRVSHLAILFILLLLPVGPAGAHTYPLRNYTVENGLPQSSILCMLQDRQGFFWFGTQSGVCRFDGFEFETFGRESGITPSRVVCLLEDRFGGIWAGTADDGLHRWNGARWSRQLTREAAGGEVRALVEAPGGVVWVATAAGVLRRDGRGWVKLPFPGGRRGVGALCLAVGPGGEIWCGTDGGGVGRFGAGGWLFTGRVDGLPMDTVTALLFDRRGRPWLISPADGAAVLENGSWTTVDTIRALGIERLTSIRLDAAGNIWLTSRGMGAVGLLPQGAVRFTRDEGLLSDDLLCMEQDREGNYWFGSISGLSRLKGMQFINFTPRDGLPDGMVWAIHEEPDRKTLLLGCNSGGISTCDGEKWHPWNSPDWIRRTAVRCFLRDSRGRLWVGTSDGLACLDGKRWTRHHVEDGLPGAVVRALAEDRAGRVWVATDCGLGVRDGLRWVAAPANPLFGRQGINALFTDREGRVWAGNSKGAAAFDGRSWRNFTTREGLPDDRVTSFSEGPDGKLWVTTFGGGICRRDGETFTVWNQTHGLSNDFTYFAVHHGGVVYVGTNRGLNRFDGHTFKIYLHEDGLASSEVNIGASLKDSRGRIWIGTVAGLTRFDPRAAGTNHVPPLVYVTSVKLMENGYTLRDGESLRHDRNNLRFEFIGIHHSAPESLVYQYNLEGLSDQWIQTRQRIVTIPYLPPGEYSFRVRARTPDGVWSPRPDSVRFEIRPPYWSTWWFRGVFLLLAAALLLVVRRIEIRNLRARSAIEEELRLAARIQGRLMPGSPPRVEGYDVAALSLPARVVGGDYHDVIRIDGRRFALCVGDVAGKGLSAALLMANVQAVVRSLVMSVPPPEEFAARTNALVCRNTGGEQFVTLFFGVLDVAAHRFLYVNAGHNPPILLRQGKPFRELTEGGLILGVLEDAVYETGEVGLEPGDLLVMFSDGVTEACGAGGAEYGTRRLMDTLTACLEGNITAAGILDCILQSVRRHAGPKGPGDDLTLLILRRLPASSDGAPGNLPT